MAHYLPTDSLAHHLGHVVTVAGWVHRIRRLGAMTFVVIRDGRGVVQILHRPTDPPLPPLMPETVVKVSGLAIPEARAPGGVELHRPVIHVFATPESPLPFHVGGRDLPVGLDLRLNEAALSLRHPDIRQIFRVQAALVQGFRHALIGEQFTEVHTPKIVATASESGADVFRVRYFDTDAYLAQSPQLYKQTLVGVFGRVFEVGPVFRAEPHDTGRHLSQYTSLDAEMGFIESHKDIMDLLRDVLAKMLAEAQPLVVASDDARWPTVPAQIPVMHFEDALHLLGGALREDLSKEPDLAPAHEQWLGAWAQRVHDSDLLFVEGYPTIKRPFYTESDPDRPDYTLSFDLLFRGQEIVTGGKRLHRYSDYRAALKARGLSEAGLEGYLAAFRYGMPPHGGFAIGLERLTARLLGLRNIREATLFPRDLQRLRP